MKKILAMAIVAMMMSSCINVGEILSDLLGGRKEKQEQARLDSISNALKEMETKLAEEKVAHEAELAKVKQQAAIAKQQAAAQPSPNAYRDDNPYAWLSQRKYSWEEFAYKASSPAQYRIWRNAMFARHGYIFKSADLREHFSQFTWYVPRYKTVTLTAVEVHNVNVLKSMVD